MVNELGQPIDEGHWSCKAELRVWYNTEAGPKLSRAMKEGFQGHVKEAEGFIKDAVKRKYAQVHAKVVQVEEVAGDSAEAQNFLQFREPPDIKIPALEDDVCKFDVDQLNYTEHPDRITIRNDALSKNIQAVFIKQADDACNVIKDTVDMAIKSELNRFKEVSENEALNAKNILDAAKNQVQNKMEGSKVKEMLEKLLPQDEAFIVVRDSLAEVLHMEVPRDDPDGDA